MIQRLIFATILAFGLAACGGSSGGGGDGGVVAPPPGDALTGFSANAVAPVVTSGNNNTAQPQPLNGVAFDFTGTDNTGQPGTVNN